MTTTNPLSLCLWLDGTAKEAAEFYTGIFPNSHIGSTSYYGPNSPMPEGSVLVCTFYIDGQEVMALNGGPMFKFTPALSLVKRCEDQAEIDHYWERLIKGGGKPSQCGWLTDRYGVSWQIVPRRLGELMSGPDRAAANRVTAAFMPMQKLDIDVLERAYRGTD